MKTIALFGAAGKMGTRIAENIKDDPEYKVLYVEGNEAGIQKLRERNLEPTTSEEASKEADVVIFAIPDRLIGKVAKEIVPSLKSGAMLICLDPAAPHAGELPDRKDVSYFVVHPCHPPLINDEIDPEARMDFFGGTKAKQNIVCALMQGTDDDYKLGEEISRKIFAPVMNAYRITVEQMAILEPAMAEVVAFTCMVIIREAMDEAIKQGVPEEVAKAFMLGHLNVDVGILFNFIDAQVSDGAKQVMERAKKTLFQPDWKEVLKPENVLKEVKAIVAGSN
ncbi:TPA: semialdehyde dehydrogenase [Candidatus Poribacteria bacterium]|nr:semialdehyde dehydrogenase [Candidatus Poribacteria bacterium]